MPHPDRPFPLTLYLGLALVVGPMVLLALGWITVALSAHARGPDAAWMRDSGMGWLTIVLGAAAVCASCEWLVLPVIAGGDHHRPTYTPLATFLIGLILSIPGYFLLRGFL